MRSLMIIVVLLSVSMISGCPGAANNQKNPFMTATEAYGASLLGGNDDDDTQASGDATEAEFRQKITLTIANHHPEAELNVSFAAWISPSNIRTGDQQDELLLNGYYQLDEEIQIGTAFTLAPGTFVYGGNGMAGTTSLRLAPTRAGSSTSTTEEDSQEGDDTQGDADSGETGVIDVSQTVEQDFELITPDVVLLYSQPPVSCDSVAFYYTIDGDPLTSEGISGVGNIFAGATSTSGGLKTLAQVDAYQCNPFEPGLFLRLGGGAVSDNEYFEGQNIRFDFSPIPTVDGYFGIVTKTTP